MTFALQRIVFGFSVMVYDRVGDGDKFDVDLERPRFYDTNHLKIETKEFFL